MTTNHSHLGDSVSVLLKVRCFVLNTFVVKKRHTVQTRLNRHVHVIKLCKLLVPVIFTNNNLLSFGGNCATHKMI